MDKIFRIVQKLVQGVSAVFFIATIAVITLNVILRSTINAPIRGVYEMTGLFTATFGSAAIVICAMKDSHISVDILTSRVKGLSKVSLAYFARIVDLIYYGTISFCAVALGYSKILTREVSDMMKIPVAPFRLWLAFCFFVTIFVRIYQMRDIREKPVRKETDI
ncbi:MAG: TRAP transporter small permease [Oscillospiraceae bacterium]|nr:TRAP transporter small permease [Oscillospiraceae bacterium]